MRNRRLVMAATAALALATLGTPGVMAGGSTTIMVDADGRATPGSCNAGGPGSALTTIDAGLDEASPGDTVLVCPGTYVEQVEITGLDGVTVRSTRPWKATIQAPADIDAPFIVGIYGADDVTFQGFRVITRTTAGCDAPDLGILALAGRRIVIRGNRVRNMGDTFGDCSFAIGIMAGYPQGPGAARGALPAGPELGDLTTTATITSNAVRDHLFIGIGAVSSFDSTAGGGYGATRADIIGNSIRFFHTGSGAGCVTSASSRLPARHARTVRRATAGLAPAGFGPCSAIGIYQGATISDSPIPGPAGDIRGNRVLSGPDADPSDLAGLTPSTPVQAMGILILDQRHATGSSRVTGNLLLRNFAGIAGIDAAGVIIRDNRAIGNGYGIAIWDTEGATVRDNVTKEGGTGIIAENEFESAPQPWLVTSDVAFTGNDARDNALESCFDETSGDGSQGTDNTWTKNRGEIDSSSPAGICGKVSPP